MTVSNTNLHKEYERLIEYQNFNFDDIKKVLLNSVEVAFIEKSEQEKLKLKVEKEINSIIKSQR